jgi:hypothetical protein
MNTMRDIDANEMSQVEGGTWIGVGMAIGTCYALWYGVPALYRWVSYRVQNYWHSQMSYSSNYGTSHYSYDNSPGL